MAKLHHRIAASIGALLFLLTSVALTITVLWSIHQQNQRDAINAGLQQALKQSQQKQQTPTPKEGKMVGTQLQNFTPTSAPVTSLQTIDTTPGTGQEVKPGDTVTADYTGALVSNGVIFDASADHGGAIAFGLDQVIKGWQQGVPGMKVGGTRRLIIPASLAYGPQAQSGIPANSDLVFDITLVKIGK